MPKPPTVPTREIKQYLLKPITSHPAGGNAADENPSEKGNETVVAAFDPMTIGQLIDNPKIESVAMEVRARLERVISAM